MDNQFLPEKDWTRRNKISVDTVLKNKQTGFLYFCSHIVPYNDIEYLYFSSYDFKDIIICVQTEQNSGCFVKRLDSEPERSFALGLFKKNYGGKVGNEF